MYTTFVCQYENSARCHIRKQIESTDCCECKRQQYDTMFERTHRTNAWNIQVTINVCRVVATYESRQKAARHELIANCDKGEMDADTESGLSGDSNMRRTFTRCIRLPYDSILND